MKFKGATEEELEHEQWCVDFYGGTCLAAGLAPKEMDGMSCLGMAGIIDNDPIVAERCQALTPPGRDWRTSYLMEDHEIELGVLERLSDEDRAWLHACGRSLESDPEHLADTVAQERMR